MEPLYRFEASLTEMVAVGLVPEGIRLDVHFAGEVTAGPLESGRLRGTDYLLLRGDGIGVIDAYETIEAGDGAVVSLHAQGYIVPPPSVPLPPPDVLLAPDFAWPDVGLPLHGFALFRTGAPQHAHLNRIAASVAGQVNVGTGRLVVEGHAPRLADAVSLEAGR